MQTVYYTTNRLICREDNIIDLARYRQAAEPMDANAFPEEARRPRAEPRRRIGGGTRPAARAGAPGGLLGEVLGRSCILMDLCASFAVLVMAAAFTLSVLG